MSDLTEFLLARIAEDEFLAKRAFEEPDVWGEDRPWEGAVAQFQDEHTPYVEFHCSRVLAECEAKRRIVDLHQIDPDSGFYDACAECGHHSGTYDTEQVRWPCPTIRAAAQPYADQPDYREEWRA